MGRARHHGGIERLAAAFVAFAMLFGVLRAGASYVYCPIMHRVMDEPCCSEERGSSHDDDGSAELRAPDCCERHLLAKLPSAGTASASPHLLPAVLVAVLPAATAASRHTGRDAGGSHARHDGRAGPAALARHRAESMVSLS